MADIILLHGAIGASDQLAPLAEALRALDHQVYTFSFSGHSRMAFHATAFGIEHFADELERFINDHHLVKPMVFGYSMGGYVALYLAHKNAEVIGSIATLATKFEWSPEIAQKEIKMLDAKIITEKVPKFAEALNRRHGDEWKVLLQKTSDMMVAMGAKNPVSPEAYAALDHPVLLGIGDKDKMVSLEETTNVLKGLKHGAMFMLPNTAHPIETVNVTLLASMLDQFWR